MSVPTQTMPLTGAERDGHGAVVPALAELWRSWGLRPRATIGHSVGEYVAVVRRT